MVNYNDTKEERSEMDAGIEPVKPLLPNERAVMAVLVHDIPFWVQQLESVYLLFAQGALAPERAG